MKILALRASSFVCVLLVLTTFTIHGANLTGLMANATFADGTTQIVRIDGIGCTESMCSTVLMKAKNAKNALVEIRFDSIATIRDIRQNEAIFVAKDGTEQRLTLVSDFRVLYVSASSGAKRKIDLAKIKSLEILGVRH
jgi:hypothetical protein